MDWDEQNPRIGEMENLMVKKCDNSSIHTFMEIIADAFDDKFPIIFRKLSREEYINLLTQLEESIVENHSDHENYLVYLNENTPVAAFRLYHAHLKPEPWGPPWKILKKRLGLFEALRSGYWLQFFSQERIPEGTLYIDAIGVKEGYRNKKIGWRLLNYIEQWAKESPYTFNRLTLYVVSHNERAIHPYKKFGFNIIGIRQSPLLRRVFGIEKFYLMEKKLK